jgi:2-amino-4-hydroxy-6-hydroxymethyldihydropteridine diphosphokinase
LNELPTGMPQVYLSLGSNKGDRLYSLARACKAISERIGNNLILSSIFETEPWGFKSEEKFFNLVLKIETRLDPVALIESLMEVESQLGRIRKNGGYESREIDIDILFYDKLVMEVTQLQIPHPRMHERKFVLIPLFEIAPEAVHPLFGKTVGQLLEICLDSTTVTMKFEKAGVPLVFKETLSAGC